MTRLLIVGAGAIGGVTAAHLARAGHDVTVLDANAEHVRLMGDPGLRFDELGSESIVPITGVTSAAELSGTFDYCLVFLKALHLGAALTPLVQRDLVRTYVSFGNGLVQNTVSALVGPESLIIGVVEWGATNLGPGHVAQTTVAPFVIGEEDGTSSERVDVLARILASAAEVRASPNVLGQVWSKLLLNSTFSGLGAVSGQLYGSIADDRAGRAAAFRVWTEGFDVATARGIELDEVAGVHPSSLVVRSPEDLPRADAALDQLMGKLAATKASMLQDLERGALTEVDVINGGVVTAAAALGIPSPLNARIVDIVHACERGERTPTIDVLNEFTVISA